MQYLDADLLRAILMPLHKINQRSLPIYFIGAGLTPLIGKMGNSRSYYERRINVPTRASTKSWTLGTHR